MFKIHNKKTKIDFAEATPKTTSKPSGEVPAGDSFDPQLYKPLRKFAIIPPRAWRKPRAEELFISEPTSKHYLKLAKRFTRTFMELGKNDYQNIESILISPGKKYRRKSEHYDASFHERRLEHWHEKRDRKFNEQQQKTAKKTAHREQKIAEREGKGFAKLSTATVYRGKLAGRGIKDYATLRGWSFQASNAICGKSLYELLPRYRSRKAGYITVRISEFTLNTVFLALGYGLAGVTDGVSKVVSDHARTVVTLGGEAITHKILGAQGRKIVTHTAIRAAQLEAPKLAIGAGEVVQMTEMGLQSLGTGTIAVSHMADLVMRMLSTRHISMMTPTDIGDSKVLYEMEVRIEYLSRFLIPYGQFMLLNEANVLQRRKLRKYLKKQGKILRGLEKKRTQATRFYQLALLGGRIPEKYRMEITADTLRASSRPLKNCNRIARQCLATLVMRDNLKPRPV